jgi:hypothetical protein
LLVVKRFKLDTTRHVFRLRKLAFILASGGNSAAGVNERKLVNTFKNKIKSVVTNVWNKTKQIVRSVKSAIFGKPAPVREIGFGSFINRHPVAVSRLKMVCTIALILGCMSLSAFAQTNAAQILTTAQDTVTTVEGIVSGVVGFFIIVKIVKWIRK